jgi:glutathione S-transferase
VPATADRRRILQIAASANDDRILVLGDPRLAIGRPLLVGGALTSAALSLAGAVYVAWRIRQTPSRAMARAVRAVARTRLA